MPRLNSFPLRLAAFPFALLLASSAFAQDPFVPVKPPNVLLVVDSSGSMEYRSGVDTFPTCSPTVGLSQKSRWIDLIEVLAGQIQSYTCQQVDRSTATFKADYGYSGADPVDANYRNPYFKPYSNGCSYMPNPAWYSRPNAFEWDDPLAKQSTGAACVGAFAPFSGTGTLSSFGDLVRFGLMTFDTLPDAGTGYTGSNGIDYASGVKGTWSYYVGTPASGHPVDCSTSQTMEVGARNGAAPPWEGRLIPFGDPDADLSTNKARHTRIGQVLMSSRPYGATPIAGALQDARDFLWNDTSKDPLDATNTKFFGPSKDLYVEGNCRDQAVILLTDGEPNLDMRPSCTLTNAGDPALNGKCPFQLPEEIAGDLYNGVAGPNGTGAKKQVKTYVIGFAKTTSDLTYSGSPKNCATMPATDWNTPGGACNTAPGTTDKSLQVCCNLHRIAEKGGSTRAEFASDPTALASKLDEIVSKVLKGVTSSLTQPVSAGVGQFDVSPSATLKTVGYKLLTSFKTAAPKGQLWPGTIERARWACESNVPKLQVKDASYGDDVSANMSANPAERYFVSFVAEDSGGGIRNSERTLRPFLSTSVTDGAGNLKGVQVHQKGLSFIPQVNENALQIPAAFLADPTGCNGLSEVDCRDYIMKWLLGFDNGSGNHRCPSASNCSLIGDVMHSTPAVVDRPTATVPDDSYRAFAESTEMKERPLMFYTSSNDGFLHGFMLSANKASDAPATLTQPSEWFAFIPPLALTKIHSQYPGTHQKNLDGVSVVRDVVAIDDSTFTDYPYKLERDATATQSASSKWRTILVQSFGGTNSGYYAVDITDPRVTTTTAKPRFLWQLTTDQAGNPLFGTTPGKPLITTLNINSKEVAVAILPGGYGGSPTGNNCARAHSGAYPEIASGYDPVGLQVHCYGPVGSVQPSRSLTVVRLDSGEIIRTFRRTSTEVHANMASKVTVSELDSPISGEAAAYPYLIGAVSDRVFVGDQDGTLWKVDFSKPDPTQWTMKLFFDAYVKYSGSGLVDHRKAISNPPVLSVDLRGQVTVALSTGDQDISGGVGDMNYVWSLTEALDSSGTSFVATPNWYLPMADGKHVVGPIQLSSEVLYFSTIMRSTDPAVAACNGATSEIWGVHYIKPYEVAGVAQLDQGGLPKLRPTSVVATGLRDKDTNFITGTDMGLQPGQIIFGVSLETPPSCVTNTSSSDAYLGGTRTKSTVNSPPAAALTFHTSGTSSQSALKFISNFETIGIAPPPPTSRNESWAAILD